MLDDGTMLRVEIVTTGREVLNGEVVNLNATWLAGQCQQAGATLTRCVTVDDDTATIAAALREAAARADVVLVTGGLGPTTDDLTLEAAAQAFHGTLEYSEDAWQQVQDFFARRGRTVSPSNRKQALIPAGSVVLPNRLGSAPGVQWEVGRSVCCFLPGIPREVEVIFTESIQPWLVAHQGGPVARERVLKCFGLPESVVGERIAALALTDVQVGYRLILPEIAVRLMTAAPDEATAVTRLEAAAVQVRAVLGDVVFGEGTATMAEVVAQRLLARGETMAAAESCTGGTVADLLTDIPGASAFFLGGMVAYANAVKTAWLGIPPEVLAQYGAVSAPVARALADGVRGRSGATYGIGITGIAGPSGGSPDKPVGTVFIGLATPSGTVVQHQVFTLSRRLFKSWVATVALNALRKAIA